MEDLSIKAIFIGVSVFVTMTVLTIIIIYYNTAKGVADVVSRRTDIASSYDIIMNADNFEDELTGVDVRSLITKYVGNDDVKINIVEINGEEPSMYKKNVNYNNVNNNSTWTINSNGARIVRESKLDIINPTWNCRVEKVQNREKITLNIYLNVEKSGEI